MTETALAVFWRNFGANTEFVVA